MVIGFGWNVLWVFSLKNGNPVRGNSRWCFLFSWCVLSIGISRYWQASTWDSGLRHCVIVCSVVQSMFCASNQVHWNCLWMPRYVAHVPVVVWSCRWLLLMLVILWVQCDFNMPPTHVSSLSLSWSSSIHPYYPPLRGSGVSPNMPPSSSLPVSPWGILRCWTSCLFHLLRRSSLLQFYVRRIYVVPPPLVLANPPILASR